MNRLKTNNIHQINRFRINRCCHPAFFFPSVSFASSNVFDPSTFQYESLPQNSRKNPLAMTKRNSKTSTQALVAPGVMQTIIIKHDPRTKWEVFRDTVFTWKVFLMISLGFALGTMSFASWEIWVWKSKQPSKTKRWMEADRGLASRLRGVLGMGDVETQLAAVALQPRDDEID